MPQANFPWTGDEAPTWDEIADKPATFPPVSATSTVVGGILQGPIVANAAGAAPTAAEYDALLAALRAAGVITS